MTGIRFLSQGLASNHFLTPALAFFSAELPPSSGLDLAISYSTWELSKVVPQTSGNQTSENFMEIPKKHTYQTPFHSFRFWYLRYLLGEFGSHDLIHHFIRRNSIKNDSLQTCSVYIHCWRLIFGKDLTGLLSRLSYFSAQAGPVRHLWKMGPRETAGKSARQVVTESETVASFASQKLNKSLQQKLSYNSTMILHYYNDERNWTFMHQTYFFWIY